MSFRTAYSDFICEYVEYRRLMNTNLTIKDLYYILRYGKWYFQWKSWEGKPMFGMEYIYYDGYHIVFHLYKISIEVYSQ